VEHRGARFREERDGERVHRRFRIVEELARSRRPQGVVGRLAFDLEHEVTVGAGDAQGDPERPASLRERHVVTERSAQTKS